MLSDLLDLPRNKNWILKHYSLTRTGSTGSQQFNSEHNFLGEPQDTFCKYDPRITIKVTAAY